METWNSQTFIETVSRKIGSAPSESSGDAWGAVRAVRWSHPAHETLTKALKEHFLAVILNPLAEVQCRVNGGKTQAASMLRGAFTFIPSGRPVDWVIRKPMRVLNVFLPGELLKKACDGFGHDYGQILSGPECLGCVDPHLEKLGSIVCDELMSGGAGGKLYIESVLGTLCTRLVSLSQDSPQKEKWRARVTLTRQQVNTVKEYMRENLDRNIGLNDISGTIGLSEFHFARCFKQETGISPYKYFMHLRMEKAEMLLRKTSLGIAEIALMIGLGSQSHFTHVFRRITGTTPADYRRRVSSTMNRHSSDHADSIW